MREDIGGNELMILCVPMMGVPQKLVCHLISNALMEKMARKKKRTETREEIERKKKERGPKNFKNRQ